MQNFLQDVRYAIRLLRNRGRFATSAVPLPYTKDNHKLCSPNLNPTCTRETGSMVKMRYE